MFVLRIAVVLFDVSLLAQVNAQCLDIISGAVYLSFIYCLIDMAVLLLVLCGIQYSYREDDILFPPFTHTHTLKTRLASVSHDDEDRSENEFESASTY